MQNETHQYPTIGLKRFDLSKSISSKNWLIKDFIEQDKIACLFGPSGSCKSFVAIDMALSVASGKERYQGMHIRNQGRPVLYICGEGADGISARVHAWASENNINNVDKFVMTDSAVMLDDPAQLVMTINTCEQIRDEFNEYPAMIIIDTLNRSFSGNENSSQDMSKLINAMSALRQRTGATVLVVHHTGNDDKERARGSSALRAALDTEILVHKNEHDKIVVKNTKMKDSADGSELVFEKKTVVVGYDQYYKEDITSLVMIKDEKYSLAKKVVEDKTEQRGLGKTQKDVLKQIIANSKESKINTQHLFEIMSGAGKTNKSTKEALAGLEARGVIETSGTDIVIKDIDLRSIIK